MKIEEGKYYKTRDGRKVGPMDRWPHDDAWQSLQTDRPLKCGLWNIDGTALYAGASDSPDLIAEWTDGPVRTVTEKTIEGGTYGRLEVLRREGDVVVVGFVKSSIAKADSWTGLTAAELRAAAAVLLELAGALPDGE